MRVLRLSALRPSQLMQLKRDLDKGERKEEFLESLRSYLFGETIADEATKDLIEATAVELTSAVFWRFVSPTDFLKPGLEVNVGRAHAFARGLPKRLRFRFRADESGVVGIETPPGDEQNFLDAEGVLDEAIVTVNAIYKDNPAQVKHGRPVKVLRFGSGIPVLARIQPTLRMSNAVKAHVDYLSRWADRV